MTLDLYGRSWRVQIGTRRFTDLDIRFEVEKSTKNEPNECRITAYNLGPDLRGVLQGSSERSVRIGLWAGYGEDPPLLFLGDLRRARTVPKSQRGGISIVRDDADIATEIEVVDGGRSYLRARVNQSFGAGASVETVLRACVTALGVGEGNLRDVISTVNLEGTRATTYPEGTVLSGSASRELNRITRSLGLTWAVQDGTLQLLRRGRALQSSAVVLRDGTGLLSAKPTEHAGKITVRAMLVPDLWPGRQIRVQSEEITGFFKVERIRYTGETRSIDDWTAEIEAVELQPRGSRRAA